MAQKLHREAWAMHRWKSRQMGQINSYKIYLFFLLLISPKIWHVRYKKLIFKGNVHAVPKNCVRYNKCPLYRGFSMRVWPWFGRFHVKLSAITRCPLYSMSAIDKFGCNRMLQSKNENNSHNLPGNEKVVKIEKSSHFKSQKYSIINLYSHPCEEMSCYFSDSTQFLWLAVHASKQAK